MDIKFKELNINCLDTINEFFREKNTLLADYFFETLLIYNNTYKYEYCIFNNSLFIKMELDKNEKFDYFYFPISNNPIDDLKILTDYSKNHGKTAIFVNITSEDLEKYKPYISKEYFIQLNIDSIDYVYETDHLSTLVGHRYNQKRRHLHKFLENYDIKNVEITKNDLDEILNFIDLWEVSSNEPYKNVENEKKSLKEIFKYFDTFNLLGFKYYINNKLVGFTLGGIINNQFIQHFEKCLDQFEGIYVYSTSYISKILKDKGIKYLNKEEDIGEPGLRKAKKSWSPDLFINNYFIILKSDSKFKIVKNYDNYDDLLSHFNSTFPDEKFNQYFKNHLLQYFNNEVLFINNDFISLKLYHDFISSIGQVRYLYGLLTVINYQKNGFMSYLIHENLVHNTILIPQNQEIVSFYEKLGFKKINTYIKTTFVSKKKNINLSGFSIEKIKIDNINSYVNAILSIFKNNISTINHIYRDQEFIRLNIIQYLNCDDEVYVLKDLNSNILGYAFYEKDQNYIREIFTLNNLFFDIFINHILLDLHINNVKCNILSKKDSNYLALGYKLESYDLFLNLLFD